MKYFGTDGIRGHVNSENINGDMFFKFGLSAGKYFTNLKKKNQTKKFICLVLNAIETRLGQLHWYCVTWPGALPSTGRRWWSSTTAGSWCWPSWLTGEIENEIFWVQQPWNHLQVRVSGWRLPRSSVFRLVKPSHTCTARMSATRTSSWRISSSWILAQPA